MKHLSAQPFLFEKGEVSFLTTYVVELNFYLFLPELVLMSILTYG